MRCAPLALLLCTACPPTESLPVGVHPPVPAGSLANDVELSRCGDRIVALVPASGDGNLDVIALPGGDLISSVFLDDANPPGPPSPFAVSAEGDLVFVTLREQNAMARVTPCDGGVAQVFTTDDVIPVDPPLTLRTPRDVDGDGDDDTDVTAMRPIAPQPVLVHADRAIAAFTNVLEFGLLGQPPVVGPGFLLRSAGAPLVLGCTNPQGLALGGDETILVSCSGPLGPDPSGAQVALDDGAIIVVDSNFNPINTISVGAFAPGTPAFVSGRIVVGSVVTPRIACLGDSFEDAAFINLDGPAVDSVFDVVPWDDTRALAVQFSNDMLHIIDVPSCTVTQSIRLTEGAARGALAIDVEPGQDVIDGAVTLALSSEIVPLSLFEVLE
jgi:hypothetical protein